MNIKITIKDADTSPLLFHKNQLSEVQSKKKNALYKQPDKKNNINKNEKIVNQQQKPVRDIKDEKNMRRTGVRSEIDQQEYVKAEKKMMEDLDKISKNQASLDMIHNSNNILRKQNEILQQNQKTLYNMTANNQKAAKNDEDVREKEKLLGQIRKQVDEMRKIKEQIQKAGKQFTRTLNQTGKTNHRQTTLQEMPQNVTQMNNNLQNLAQISKNHIEGLQNMEAIKSLQNFNIQGYTQAINGLKRQIVQYQKQSEQIERQLKLRAAKLEKLQINPNYDQELLVPYQNYLKKRADAIDLHAIKQKTYEKLGHFDYSKFQFDISQIMAEVKNEMNEFNIVCKQYRVQVPEIKIDQKELKGLDLKLPSAIDQYKAERGIDFSKQADTNKNVIPQDLGESRQRRLRKKGEPILSLKQTNKNLKSQKLPHAIRQLNSKPLDLTTQVKFQKTNQPVQKTILQNERQREKKVVQGNFKKGKIAKQDEDFQKYLQYRAREQLELLYKEKQQRLQKKQRQIYQYCKDEPEVYLNLDLQNQIRLQRSLEGKKKEEVVKPSPRKQVSRQKQRDQVEQSQKIPQLKPIVGTEGQTIKSVGTEILKEKLKNLLGGQHVPKKQPETYQQNFQQNISQPDLKMENVAGNFLSLINNTLTQVNNQLSRTIQQKFQNKSLSKQKKQVYRRSPPKLVIPTLQEFRPPPAFNLPNFPMEPDRRAYPQPVPFIETAPKPHIQKKIVQKNYQHLKISDQDEKYQDLQISNSENYDQDFQS